MLMNTFVLEVTPNIARDWLKSNTENRSIKSSKVDQYARDILSGNWQVTHQGIAFYNDGTLADGQHRLHAIIQSNTPIKTLVTMNLPKSTMSVLDVGKMREAHDIAKLGSYPNWINPNTIAIVRALIGKLQNSKVTVSFAEILSYCTKYQRSIEFVNSIMSSKKKAVTSAIVGASYVCALEAGCSPDKIKRFAEIMYNGEINGPHENAAIRLRETLISNPNCWVGTEKFETAKKVHKCLHNFCNKTQMERLASQATLKFPIPT
jgi:hypothetical protein